MRSCVDTDIYHMVLYSVFVFVCLFVFVLLLVRRVLQAVSEGVTPTSFGQIYSFNATLSKKESVTEQWKGHSLTALSDGKAIF